MDLSSSVFISKVDSKENLSNNISKESLSKDILVKNDDVVYSKENLEIYISTILNHKFQFINERDFKGDIKQIILDEITPELSFEEIYKSIINGVTIYKIPSELLELFQIPHKELGLSFHQLNSFKTISEEKEDELLQMGIFIKYFFSP